MLSRVLELFRDRSKWTQGTYSRDGKFCLWGACDMLKVSNETWNKLSKLSYRRFNMGPINVNDKLGYEAVISLLEEAIV